jgi:hypothetical protein
VINVFPFRLTVPPLEEEFLDMVAGLNMAGLTATISAGENCK